MALCGELALEEAVKFRKTDCGMDERTMLPLASRKLL
jgi:hypothetical protein